ncbi:MAG: hypothetical protein IT529_05350 [Burkholderiales bacterium]|nr:hypothetical protein [Burkholderiales bacterium]
MSSLDLASFPVHRAAFGGATRYAEGELTVSREAVRDEVLRDRRIADVEPALVHPGDSARIVRVLDGVEPLAKVAGPSCAFPGFNGPPRTCGSGRTHRLAGFTVMAVSDFPCPASGVQAFEEGIVEMSGPGAQYSSASDRVNLLLVFQPGAVSNNDEYDDAMRRATLRVAGTLAGATRGLAPPLLETFDSSREWPGLPRVVWIHQVRSQGPMVRTFLYGHDMTGCVPTVLDPNELIDGALVGANYKVGTRTPTYRHTWHPSLAALYRRHGSDVNFAGVILARGHHENEFLKERSANIAAKLAKMLRADGAVCTYEGTGNTHIDFMLTVRALEEAGIPAGAVVHEYGGPGGRDVPLVDFVPEAVALASSGGIDRRVRLPAVEQLFGGTRLAHRGEPARGELDLPLQELYAVTVEMNLRGYRAEEY